MTLTLKRVLRNTWTASQSVQTEPHAGGRKPRDRPLSPEDAARLRSDLQHALGRNKPLLWMVFAMIGLLIACTGVFLLSNLHTLQGARLVSAASGGLATLLIPAAMRLWREITRIELMIAIATEVQGDALTGLVRRLLESL